MFEQLKLQRDEPWFKLKMILSAIAIGLGVLGIWRFLK
jgi:hypothetical protein